MSIAPECFSIRRFIIKGVLAAAAFTLATPGSAVADAMVRRTLRAVRSDSSEAIAAITRFHAALASGDSAAALALLAPDALIVESGTIETRAEYRASHLAAGIGAARAGRSTRSVTRVAVQGDVAWVVSASASQRQANGRQVNSTGAELVVLRRTPAGWQITAIHWSSRRR